MNKLLKSTLLASALALSTAQFVHAQVAAPNDAPAADPAAPAPAAAPSPAPAATPPPATPPSDPAKDGGGNNGGVQEVNDAKAIEQLLLIVESQKEALKNQTDQIKKQDDQLAKMDEQLASMTKQLAAMTGAKNMSTVGTAPGGDSPLKAADSLQQIVDGAIAGGGAGGRLDTIISDIKSKLELTTLPELKASKEDSDRLNADLAAASLAASATAQDEYIRSNESMARIDALVKEIDKTPDLKASVDLNTRVLSELGQSINETIRTQSSTTLNISSIILAIVKSEIDLGKDLKFDYSK